jgi:hypothetical protein
LTRHWSSTTVARPCCPLGEAWVIDFSNGDVTVYGKDNIIFVRAVRGGKE